MIIPPGLVPVFLYRSRDAVTILTHIMKFKGITLIGFDMDGTLFNSFSASYDALYEGFEGFWKEMGTTGPIPDWEFVKSLIGLPSYEFYPQCLPKEFKSQWEVLHRHVGDAERRRLEAGQGRTFDGVHANLEVLKSNGFELGMLSNASKVYFDSVLDGCDLRRFFGRLSHLGDNFLQNKADMLEVWAVEMGGADRVVYVGDRAGDIQSAHAAGVKAVGVTWGYGSRRELADADAIINRMDELPGLFGL